MHDTVIVLTREGMGEADRELQLRLIETYLKLLLENGSLPGAMCFYANGVKLATEGSPVLEQLLDLEKHGVHLILCRTCLTYLGLEEKVRVGIVGGMSDILAALATAAKVISL